MLDHYIRDPSHEKRLRSGPLGPYLDAYGASSVSLGYAFSSTQRQFFVLADLSRWLQARGLQATDLDADTVDAFLDEQRRQRCLNRSRPATVRRFVGLLRGKGVLPPLPVQAVDDAPRAVLVQRYRKYLGEERGLATVTIDGYVPFIERLLAERFADEPVDLSLLKPADISGFVLRHVDTMSRGRAKLMVTSLRSFFRFIFHSEGVTTNLADGVLGVADWRLSGVPKYLARVEVERVLEACDLDTSIGRRDRTILLLLARLGFRAGEIVRLQLEDINWREAEITVRGKGMLQDRMPLPSDVGESLATYLSRDRPPTASIRNVFVCAKAPVRALATAATVSTIVCCAIERAGLNPPARGAHLLRHSLATTMLGAGASLAEIGEVLRHRSPSTTEIYAKVDIAGLASVAMPWPGTGGRQ